LKALLHKNRGNRDEHERKREKDTVSSHIVNIVVWSPVLSPADPSFREKIGETAYGDRPLAGGPTEGYKSMLKSEILVDENNLCPFHRKMDQGKTYGECCQKKYQNSKLELFYDPLEADEAAWFQDYADRKIKES